MLPPPRNGGMASSSSARPHSTPMPDGPHILWLEKATKSASQACTSVALWGTYWQASTMASAPAAWAAAQRSVTGVRVPSTLLIAVNDSLGAVEQAVEVGEVELAVGRSVESSAARCRRSAASMCHGTMLAWCSISVSTTTSPAARWARPHDWATRLSASVAFLVKTISSGWPALTKRATPWRAPSKASVASAASR